MANLSGGASSPETEAEHSCSCGCDHSQNHLYPKETPEEAARRILNEPGPLQGICSCDVKAAVPEVWPEDLEGLKDVLKAAEAKINDCQRHIKALTRGENPADGTYYAQQIHVAKQLKMMAKYQRDLCAARIRRLENAARGVF